MGGTVKLDELLTPRLPTRDVEVPGVGTVKVRGLSRAEMLEVNQQVRGGDELVMERKLLARAMVEPQMTEAQVGKWQQAAAAGEMQPVVEAVIDLSGLNAEEAKRAYKEMASNSDAEFRLPAR